MDTGAVRLDELGEPLHDVWVFACHVDSFRRIVPRLKSSGGDWTCDFVSPDAHS